MLLLFLVGITRTNTCRRERIVQNRSNFQCELASDSYVKLILFCTLGFEAITLHCGNITDKHAAIADTIAETISYLVEHLRERNIQLCMVALEVQGYATILQNRVASHLNEDGTITSIKVLYEVFQVLDSIVENSYRLTQTKDLCTLSFDDQASLASTAVFNAKYHLNWLLPSDWDKANFYCERTLRLLTNQRGEQKMVKDPTDEAVNAKFQGTVEVLSDAVRALKNKHYQDSKYFLRATTAALQMITGPKSRETL